MCNQLTYPTETLPQQTNAENECFISSELRGGMETLWARYCWFCSTEQAYHLWKHWRPTGSVQIINMHGNQYIFGSGGEKNWEKHRKRVEALECSSSFITVIYSLSLSSLCTHVHIHTHTCARTRTHTDTHICMHSKGERERKNMSRSANYPFFSVRPSLWGCAVSNSKCTPVTISQTVYLSFQVHEGGKRADWDRGSFIHWLPF